MSLSTIKHFPAGRRFAALVTVLAVLFATVVTSWHIEHPASGAGFEAQIAVSLSIDAGTPEADHSAPVGKAGQDCAFHCDQHSRSLPVIAMDSADVLPKALKLLAQRDDMAAVAQPDGLLEPPKA